MLMFIFGLTGPSGAGKGTIAELFAKYKVYSVDTDAVYHRLLIPPSACLDELTARFGTGVSSPDGSLNRQALAAVVFSDDNALADLNAITHKYILARTKEALDLYRAGNCPGAIVDAPLLFESGAVQACGCQATIAVLADKSLRVSRIMERDGLTQEAAVHRIEAQKPDDFYIARADYVIYNNGLVSDLLPQVQRILRETAVIGQ